MTTKILKIVVAISGGGRSLLNLIHKKKDYSYDIVGVISSSSNALGLNHAKNNSIPFINFDFKDHKTTKKLYDWLDHLKPDLVVLAGFLKKFPVSPDWHYKIINIHPALLPKYGGKGMYGLKVHQAVFNNKDKVSGASVHFVNDHYDDGAIISQITINIDDCKSAEEIAAKVFLAECDLLPNTLKAISKK